MSSSNDIPHLVPEDNHNKETKLTTPPATTIPSNGLSLFDQLKNSADHNSVTKTALISNAPQRHEDKFKTQPKNEQESNVSDATALPPPPSPSTPVVKNKPEFQTPTLFPPPSSNGNASFLSSAASTKRLQNANAKFPLKPPNPKDLTTTLRSLKRSQPPPPPPPTNFAATQKTGPLAYSLTAAVGAAAALSSTAAGSAVSRHSSAAADSTSSINHNAKKKRCTDRYDSSESSDSGVATSSCTDSSTGSSEDASEPGSPFSPQSLSEDHHQLQLQQQQQQQKQSSNTQNINNKMSPQTTILVASNTSNPQNAAVTTSSSATSSLTSSSSVVSSLNAAIRTSNLPASLTITPTNGSGGGNGNANKSKLPITQITKSSNTANTSRCSNLPTLQWPWSTTATATTNMSSSAPAYSPSTTASTSSTGTNTHITHSSAGTTTNTSNQAKKRIAPYANGGASDAATTAKKPRSNVNTTQQDNHGHVVTAAGAKRLKAAALEESQTKITGYFKSQMKAQIHAANNKAAPTIHSMSNSNVMMTTTTATSANHNNSTMTTNALTMSAPATTASLNKYFNILAQLKENSKATNNVANGGGSNGVGATQTPAANAATSLATTSSAPPSAPMPSVMAPAVPTTSFNTSGVTITASKGQNMSVAPMPMPALKKIERPKPTKIAQVAPNLRKTPSTNHTYASLSTGTGKSPAKKHVAIAPRTPEMKQQQQQQQQQLISNKQESSKQSSVANAQATAVAQATASSSSSQQPAVLLTAIRLPPGQTNQQNSTQTKPGMNTNKLTTTSPVVAANTTGQVAVPTSSHSAGTAPTAATTLYQLPAVQLPNLVQLPQLLAANGANLMQLNNMATAAVAKNVASTAASTTTAATAATSATSAQAAQAAAAQYFLNGTVFKLQQFTTATTTTATTSSTANVNPFNFLSASDLQDLLIKQQQQQQQLQQLQQQQQQQQQKAAVAANATSFQEIFQQQIAAAIAANQQQQQQQAQLQQLQRLGAAANMQQQPVFMATPAGLLLNAASLPAMLAQAAAALAVNTQQQQQHQQQQKTIALPALQPIQQAPLPALSSIFAPPSDHQQDMQQQHQQQQHQHLAAQLALAQQQQFITATQPPPLSSVALTPNAVNLSHNSNNNNTGTNNNITNISNNSLSMQAGAATSSSNTTAKLAIVKANATPVAFTTLSSQPPPLVTISNAKTRTHLAPTNSSNGVNGTAQKPSVMAKPYQKRSPKAQGGQQVKSSMASTTTTKTNAGKITTASGKIIATPTTPPPLVPTMTATVQQPVALTTIPAPGIRAATATNLAKTSQIPTPALVSIAPTNVTPIAPKPAQSITCGSVTISPANSTASTVKNLVNIAPKVSTSTSSMAAQAFKYNSKTTNSYMSSVTTSTFSSGSNNVGKTKNTMTKSSASDLFDLVKNSNGAISITPAAPIPTPVTTVAATFNSHNFNAPLNFSSTSTPPSINTFKSLLPLESFGKIKDEPMDDGPMNSTIISCGSTTNPSITPLTTATLNTENKDIVQQETPTSFSGQIPMSNIHIKEELMNSPSPTTLEEECASSSSLEKTSLSQPSNLNHECSSSSFSSNSNSISSAADLSLEASTPASITSSSEAPSPGCSILSPLNTSNNDFATPNPCSNSNSAVDSNSLSNSCETQGGASSRDMLSEMVTSTCISSDSSEASISVSLPENEDGKQAMDGSKSNDDHEDKQRDLPTPESGIGGSLSNTESMDSSSKSSTSDASSTSSASSEQVPSPTSADTQTPPATPMNIDSSSMEETQNNTTPSQTSTQQSEDSSEKSSFNFLTTTIDTTLAEGTSPELPKCALSPILSQPKTIRFPVMGKGNKRHDGICYWDKCNKKHESNSKLLDHMQQHHVNSQTGPFSCLWVGCKVYNKESCSRRWLERHVLSHGGSKQFKCIVEGCGLRFGSQLALQKHINNHFTATESKDSTNKRTSDPPVPKQLRKNGKKLRYRRQPFSARMFDFFDTGIMEGLQHRLRQISTLTNGCNSITFQGQCIMKRKNSSGKTECYIQWSPREIISDEWLPESEVAYLKTVNIKQMKASEKNKVESLLMTAYKLPYSPTIFENDYALSRQHQRLRNEHEVGEPKVADDATDKNAGDNEEGNGDDDDGDEEDEDEDATTSTETISSYQHVLSITNIQMQQRRKHPRKPQNRINITR